MRGIGLSKNGTLARRILRNLEMRRPDYWRAEERMTKAH
jgi:hypothetical protein